MTDLSKQLRDDDGFSIIEILVSFTLLAIVTIGTVPLFVSGMRGTLTSKMDTGGKNLSQQRIEQMRNLPFHVDVTSPSPPTTCVTPAYTKAIAAAASCDYRDMLDTYYRSAKSPEGYATSTVTSGYVSDPTKRDPDEPSVPFYRFVINPISGFSGRYAQFVVTQFLDVNRNPVTPAATYNSQVSGYDFPPSRFVGVTVITRWVAGGLTRKFVTFTQISDARPPAATVVLQARATALRISASMADGSPLSMEAGISSSDGSLSNGASVTTKVLSAFAELSGIGGSRVEGKSASSSAPPNQPALSDDGTDTRELTAPNGDTLAFFGRTRFDDVLARIDNEQPVVADSPEDDQSRAELKRTGDSGETLLRFTNRRVSLDPVGNPLTLIDANAPLVRIAQSTSEPAARGATHLKAVGGSSHTATAKARVRTQTIGMFFTAIPGAESGIIKVKIDPTELTCDVNTSGSSATLNPKAITVQYFSNATYVTADITALPDPSTVTVFGALRLSDYISNWSGQFSPQVSVSTTTKVSANVDMLSILTNPLRTDANSRVDMKFGSMSCLAEDTRG